MAKNYLQDGKTLTFIADDDYQSGDMVRVGERVVIAVTDVRKGCAGTGLAEGVFTLPKMKAGNAIRTGQRVYEKHRVVVAGAAEGALMIGTAWEDAAAGAAVAVVKIHG